MGQKLNINWFYTVFCFNFDISKINVQTIILIIFSIAYAFWKGGLIPDSDLFYRMDLSVKNVEVTVSYF